MFSPVLRGFMMYYNKLVSIYYVKYCYILNLWLQNLFAFIKLLSTNKVITIPVTYIKSSQVNVNELLVNHQSKQKSIKKIVLKCSTYYIAKH